MTSPQPIAIVGMSGLFPGARDMRTFWQNILDKACFVQDAPEEWTRNYLQPDSPDPERIYTRKVGLLGDLAEFNPLEFGVLPTSVDAGEPDHFLALKLARDALKDAGYLDKPFMGEKTGIILGRGSNPNRGSTTAMQYGLVSDQTIALLRQILPDLDEETLEIIRKDLRSHLPLLPPEAAPGLVSNVASGRIANRLNLMGPNYMIDAACSSSLIAVELAMKELWSGRSEMMLAGGTQSSMPPQIYMLFCRLGALARQGTIRPFDKNAMGTLLGEGVGFLVLKPLDAAVRDADRVYAVLKGVGTSSDGKALGLLAPRFEGQILALERAYGESGVDPSTVDLVEAHGTGIPVGDQTEIKTLKHIFGPRQKPLPHCALGSVKSMIGHCIPASGVASIIKMSLSLYHKVLPPTLCDELNPDLKIEETPFYINTETRPWIHEAATPRRAAVNAFGFGGINTHAILEEYTGPQPYLPKQLNQKWPFELLVLAGSTKEELIARAEQVQQRLTLQPAFTLANLAYTLAQDTTGNYRLAVVAQDLTDLDKKLTQALEKLKAGGRTKLQGRNGVYYEEVDPSQPVPKTAFLFPGQGGQYVGMLADLAMYFPVVRQWFDFLNETFRERQQLPSHYIYPPPTVLTPEERQKAADQLFSMDLSSESVYTATMAMYELLKEFQVACDVMVGHSTGENMVLEAAGISHVNTWERRKEILRGVNRIYLELEAASNIITGANLSVGAVDCTLLDQILTEYQGRVHMSVDNCPNQVVLYGSPEDIDTLAARLKTEGGICGRLPFVYPYHTPLFDMVADILHRYYSTFTEGGPPHTPVYSCATAQPYPSTRDEILALAAGQWSARVRFRETIENLYKDEQIRVFIEVGPSGNLTAFVNDILSGKKDMLALASNNQRRTGLEHMEHLLARLFVKGMQVDLGTLFRYREVQLVDLVPVIPVKPLRAIPIINQILPIMSLSEGVVETVRAKLQPALNLPLPAFVKPAAVEPVVLPAKPAPEPLIPKVERAALQPMPAPEPAAVNKVESRALPETPQLELTATWNDETEDTRGILIQEHFALMQEFLQGQGRVISSFYAQPIAMEYLEGAEFEEIYEETPVCDPHSPLTFEELWPMLGNVLEIDAQHLYAERHFNIHQDVFIRSHILGGATSVSPRRPELFPLPILPFTICMEMIAEAANYLVGGDKKVIGMNNVRSYTWIGLDRGLLTLGMNAKLFPQKDPTIWTVQVQIFRGEGNTKRKVFEGFVRLAENYPAYPEPLPFNLADAKPYPCADEDLYRVTDMFHGPILQSVKHIRHWSTDGIEGDLQNIGSEFFFNHIPRPRFQVEAGLLDGGGQMLGFWGQTHTGLIERLQRADSEDISLLVPFELKAFHQYQDPVPDGTWVLCRNQNAPTSPETYSASFDLIDQAGRVICRKEGLQERSIKFPMRFHRRITNPQTAFLGQRWLPESGVFCRRMDPPPENLFRDFSFWGTVHAHAALSAQELDLYYGLPTDGDRRSQWLWGRCAVKDAIRDWAQAIYNFDLSPADLEIFGDDQGKPYLVCPELTALGPLPDISISHSRTFIIGAVQGPGVRLGVDVERLDEPRASDWHHLAFSAEEKLLFPSQLLVAFWCAKEAAAKATGFGLYNPLQWVITEATAQQVTILHQGIRYPVRLWITGAEVLAVCQYPGE